MTSRIQDQAPLTTESLLTPETLPSKPPQATAVVLVPQGLAQILEGRRRRSTPWVHTMEKAAEVLSRRWNMKADHLHTWHADLRRMVIGFMEDLRREVVVAHLLSMAAAEVAIRHAEVTVLLQEAALVREAALHQCGLGHRLAVGFSEGVIPRGAVLDRLGIEPWGQPQLVQVLEWRRAQ